MFLLQLHYIDEHDNDFIVCISPLPSSSTNNTIDLYIQTLPIAGNCYMTLLKITITIWIRIETSRGPPSSYIE